MPGQAAPYNSGADVRVVDDPAGASATASERSVGCPPKEAESRDLIAMIYRDLSMWLEAKAEDARALALWTEHAGPDDPRTLLVE